MIVKWNEHSFPLEAGKLVYLYGPNGIGKTTLVENLVAHKEQIFPTNWVISYLFQTPLLPLGDRRPIDLIQGIKKRPKVTIHPILEEIISHPNKMAYRSVRLLSGGENQWLKIGLLLSLDAELYIWDEPTNFLDITKKKRLSFILKEIIQQKRFIIIEHDEDFVHSIGSKDNISLELIGSRNS